MRIDSCDGKEVVGWGVVGDKATTSTWSGWYKLAEEAVRMHARTAPFEKSQRGPRERGESPPTIPAQQEFVGLSLLRATR